MLRFVRRENAKNYRHLLEQTTDEAGRQRCRSNGQLGTLCGDELVGRLIEHDERQNVRLLERFSDLHEPHRPHFISASRVLNEQSSYSTNERVQLAHIQTGVAIVLAS